MDMTIVKPFACKADGCGMSFTNEDHLTLHESKHEMMLNLSPNGQKYANLFTADQTPTPTRLIKNCEEVGLFDDLRHVNPFDETFRRAVEQKNVHTANSLLDSLAEEEETSASLHTPQLFPHVEVSDTSSIRSNESLQKVADSPGVNIVEQIMLSEATAEDKVCEMPATQQHSNSSSSGWSWCGGKLHRYRSIAEKPAEKENQNNRILDTNVLPISIQLIQPQLITLSFDNRGATPTPISNNHNDNFSNTNNSSRKPSSGITAAIPVQTVKPFILPKLTPLATSSVTELIVPQSSLQTATAAATVEPSSASLTPTSQLPIKERLKIILSNSSKSRIIELPQKKSTRSLRNMMPADRNSSYKDDADIIMERRRAASTRYRIKMRSLHVDLRRRNSELQSENDKLKQRVKQLEMELEKVKIATAHNVGDIHEASNRQPQAVCTPAQIHIPPSTVHLVMNIPQLIIPPSGQPIMKNPVTFQVEKK